MPGCGLGGVSQQPPATESRPGGTQGGLVQLRDRQSQPWERKGSEAAEWELAQHSSYKGMKMAKKTQFI